VDTAAAPSVALTPPSPLPVRLRLGLRGQIRYSIGIAATLLTAGACSLVFPHFGTLDNAANILSLFGPLAVLSVGQMIVVLIRGFDLSVGAVFALATVIAAQAMNAAGLVGLLAAPVVGIVFGLINGVLVSYFRVQPVIATLGSLLLARGIALLAAPNGQAVIIGGDSQTALLNLQVATICGVPLSALFAALVFLLVAIVLYATRFGRRLAMVGGDPAAAALVGVRVRAVSVAGYVLCGFCAGLTAILIMMRTGLGLPTEGVGMEVQSLAGAVIGGTQLSGGYANPLGVFFAALFIQTTQSGLNFSGISPYAAEMVMGGSILLAGLLDRVSRRIFKGS
jgi:ribose transport system permease protein